MEKFKLYLSVALKNQFWILCSVVVLVGLSSWYVASANLRETTRKNKKKIEEGFSAVDRLRNVRMETTKISQAVHPNDKIKQKTEEIIEELGVKVKEAWEKQYAYQGDEVFIWPEELTPKFINAVKGLRPIESMPLNHEISVDFRSIYRDYIKKELPKLADIIGAKWDPGTTGSGGGRGGGGIGGGGVGGIGGVGGVGGGGNNNEAEADPDLDKYKVDWSKANQAYFQNERLNWSHMPDETPNTLQLLYAQEDLWVLRALMVIIDKTNGEAESRHDAAIRKIDSILLGAEAVKGSSRVTRVGGESAGSSGSSGGGVGGPGGGVGGPGGGVGGPGGGVGGPGGGVGGPGGGVGGPGGGVGGPGGGVGGPGGGQPSGGVPGAPGAGGGGGNQPGVPGGGGAGQGAGIPGGGGAGQGAGIPGGGGVGQPGAGGGGQSSGSSGFTTNKADPADNRYVDRNYLPLSATTLRNAAASKNPADAYLAVAKRMPVRLKLEMDQKHLNRFLAECGNSPLTVEVRQVRFNCTEGSMNSGGSGGSNRAGGVGGFGAGGGLGNAGFGGGQGRGESAGPQVNFRPWDRPVEIYAIVYIYNPAEPEKLKFKPGTAVVAGGTPASKPAGGPTGGAGGPVGGPVGGGAGGPVGGPVGGGAGGPVGGPVGGGAGGPVGGPVGGGGLPGSPAATGR